MDLLIDKRYKEERIIAYNTVEKIKDAAATLESKDPSHRNGVKFLISKKQYHSIIEPMLIAKSENESAKFVKSFVPESKIEEYMNENILDSIKNFAEYIKDGSIKSALKLIGLILKKSGVKKISR